MSAFGSKHNYDQDLSDLQGSAGGIAVLIIAVFYIAYQFIELFYVAFKDASAEIDTEYAQEQQPTRTVFNKKLPE